MERRNAEGYHDPTAYGGMRMAEQKAEKETVNIILLGSHQFPA